MDAPSRSQREGDRGRPGKFRPLSSALCAVKTPEPQRSRSTRRKTLTTLRALCALCGARLFGPWLLDLGLGAGVDQLLQNCFRVRFGHAFLHGLGRSIHQVLGFLQPEPGELADRLDHVDLVFAETGEHDLKLGLLLHRGRSAAAARPAPPRSARALAAELTVLSLLVLQEGVHLCALLMVSFFFIYEVINST